MTMLTRNYEAKMLKNEQVKTLLKTSEEYTTIMKRPAFIPNADNSSNAGFGGRSGNANND